MTTVFIRFTLAALASIWLAGCAWVPQKVIIAPQLEAPAVRLGNGATVVVKVTDIRSSSKIGSRGLDSGGAAITIDQDLALLFRQKIIEGLNQQGFTAVPASAEPATVLKVEIRLLQYTSTMDFWKGTIQAKVALQAYAKTTYGIHDQLYVAEKQEHPIEAPGAKTNSRLINGAVSEVLQQLLEDKILLRILAN